MSESEKPRDAVEILRRRYVGDDPERLRALEGERIHAKVARQIYDLRKAARLTQDELAKRVGTTQSVISRLEDADYEGHSLTMLRRVAAALDAEVDVDLEPKDVALAQEVREPVSDNLSSRARQEERSRRKGRAVLVGEPRGGRTALLPLEYFDSFRRLTDDARRAEELLLNSDVQRAMTAYSDQLLDHLRQMQQPLDEVFNAMERVVLWSGLQQHQVTRLQQQLQNSLAEISSAGPLARFQPSYGELALMVDSARGTWEPILEDAATSYAFTAMSALAEAIQTGPFSRDSVAALHSQLGDWTRTRLDAELVDSRSRQDLYFQLGLEARLVEPQPEIFDSILVASGIREPQPPPLIPFYASFDVEADVQKEEPDQKAAEDYRWLFRFESQARAFIDRILTEAVGPNWIRHRLHGRTENEWKERRDEARRTEAQGEANEGLLSYASFGDLPAIICRKDNWPSFAPYFRRKQLVQESFARLVPLPNDIAHSRALTRADRLYLHTEIHRLSVAFRSEPRTADGAVLE